MPRQIKNLRIEEVSSVDRGAGKGVRVLLMKRATERNDEMNIEQVQKILGPVHLSKRAHTLVSNGQISEVKFAEMQQEIALQMFGAESRSVGEALNKYFSCAAGQATLAPRPLLSAQQNWTLQKAEAERDDVPHARLAQPDDDDAIDADKALDEMAAEHRKNDPKLTHAQAVTAVLATPQGNEAYQRARSKHLAKNG
jgi:hypothetical protein